MTFWSTFVFRAAALRLFRSRHSAYVLEQQRFTRPQLEALVKSQGIRIRRLTYANFLLSPVAFLRFRLWEPLTVAVPLREDPPAHARLPALSPLHETLQRFQIVKDAAV